MVASVTMLTSNSAARGEMGAYLGVHANVGRLARPGSRVVVAAPPQLRRLAEVDAILAGTREAKAVYAGIFGQMRKHETGRADRDCANFAPVERHTDSHLRVPLNP
jgi:hypothetical protein